MGYLVHRLTVGLVMVSLILSALIVTSGIVEGADPLLQSEKRIDVEKGIVAFVEVTPEKPSTIYIMYPAQYNKYKSTGSLEGALEYRKITWFLFPVPAMLEGQTVYVASTGKATFDVKRENIQERIDALVRGEERIRAGMEMQVEQGIEVIRLTPLIPDLKVRLDFSQEARFAIAETIDFAKYRKGMKGFDQVYDEAALKGSGNGFDFSTENFEDLYLFVKSSSPGRVRYIIRATKGSAESGC